MPNNTDLVTVILPVRNGEPFLAEAIESVLGQSHRPLDLVVIDGRSTDRSADIARSYPEVTYVLQDQPADEDSFGGLTNAWNIGLDLARGDLIAFIGADDRWRPGKLEAQVRALTRDAAALGSITMFRFFVEPGSQPPPGFNRSLIGRDLVGHLLETLVVRRQVFEMVGRFEHSFTTAQDVDWFMRASELNLSWTLVEEVHLDKRIHGGNLTWNTRRLNEALLQIVGTSIRRRRDEM